MDYVFNVYKNKEDIEINKGDVSIIFVLNGEATVFKKKNLIIYDKYSFFLIRPYQSPELIICSGEIIVLSINKLSFNRFALFNWTKDLKNKNIDNDIVESYLSTIKALYEKDNFSADINIIKLINFIRGSKYYKDYTTSNTNPLIKEVIDYIDQNYNKILTVSAIADEFYVNPSYLSRIFSEHMNITLLAYIRKIKMFRLATEMLFISNPNDLWRNYGYESYETYLKHFKIVFSVSPLEFISNYENKSGRETFFTDTVYKQIKQLLKDKPYLE